MVEGRKLIRSAIFHIFRWVTTRITFILTLAATQGSEIRLVVSGKDEKNAAAALSGLIQDRFEEAE